MLNCSTIILNFWINTKYCTKTQNIILDYNENTIILNCYTNTKILDYSLIQKYWTIGQNIFVFM